MTAATDPAPELLDHHNSTSLLARTNLLRLETAELLSESTLHVHPPALASTTSSSTSLAIGEERAHYEARWSPLVRKYLHQVNDILLSSLGQGTTRLSPDLCAVDGGYRIPLQSDKFQKHVRGDSHGDSQWEFPAPKHLTLHPVGSFAHLGNAGLTNRHANGNNVPVLDVAVLISEEGFVGGKDYLNGRYFDKRNILAVHIAKQLSQKKHRSKVGAVHLTNLFGDSRKVALLLTPPADMEDTTKPPEKKRKKNNDDGPKNTSKVKFRIRLIFGMQQDISAKKHRGHEYINSDDDDDDDDEEESEWNCWIPRTRLFPDRSNNRSEKQHTDSLIADGSTPHYTNSIAEDLHFVSTSRLITTTLVSLTGGSASVASNMNPVSSSFHETLILLKVWALQRGLLRGHDSFTTTTLAVILVYLYRTKGIGKRMGSMQAFTAFMKFWSEVDWLGEDSLTSDTCVGTATVTRAEMVLQRKVLKKAAFVIPGEGRNESQTIDHCEQARLYLKDVRENNSGTGADRLTPRTLLDSYKLHYTSSSSAFTLCNSHHDSPILLDPTMTINYLARLSPSFVRESRAEAYAALKYIHGHEHEEVGGGAFRKLFLETNRFWTRYDAFIRVPMRCVPKLATLGVRKKKGDVSSSGCRVWGNDVDDLGHNESVCRGVVEVLSLALGDRVSAVRALTCGNGDIQNPSSVHSADDVATKCFADSDQCLAVPIRGNSSNRVHVAELSFRAPEPPVLLLSEQYPCLVIALRIDPNASRRVVDRGPPAEDVEGSTAFVTLWGEKFAQLRRFQDGAIVQAVVWTATSTDGTQPDNVRFSGDDKSMGGIVEKVAQHIVKLHFAERSSKLVAFELRNMVSFIDGVCTEKPSPLSDSLSLHKNVMLAFDALSDFLRRNTATIVDNSLGKGKKVSKLGLPLSIDDVEPLSPCLRYSSLFPPVPHPSLGGMELGDSRKVSGVIDGEPILIQIRFEGSSRWPTSLNAMGAAKCAMLIQLAEGIQKMKDERGTSGNDEVDAFDGPMDITPNHLTLGYRGYSWRIIVRADQELRMLKNLKNPTDDAKKLQLSLVNRHVRGSMHHSLIHAVHTRHPSASAVVRLASRWIASHMLSDILPHGAIELMVAKIYTESTDTTNAKLHAVSAPPSTVMSGFLRFLQLLSTHDWAREPLIVDPQSHISSYNRALIYSQFNAIRGPDRNKGPPMYIISPADYDGVDEMTGSKVVGMEESTSQTVALSNRMWAPTITAIHPERVVLSRASALAKRSHDHLISCAMRGGSSNNDWTAAFHESPASLTSYSALLRVDSSFITDEGCSSTCADCVIISSAKSSGHITQVQSPFERSIQKRFDGPKELRRKHYKNLVLKKDTLHEWNPVKSLVSTLRTKYHQYSVFFYNEYCPDVIAMLWRPASFVSQPFSAMISEFQHPVVINSWKEDTLVVTNTDDLMYEIGFSSRDIVTNMKVLDNRRSNNNSVKCNKQSHPQEEMDTEENCN
eukprot:CCRYP_010222-RA/>CCRYP_010222-RA protein AED:0.03 eAED:0.03 QI:184/1/1/1/0.75/0.6/5/416/1480